MNQRDANDAPRRRGFLRALGLGGAAAATATVPAALAAESPSRADAVPRDLARKENAAERVAARYRETDHVKLFYATNRY